ncbi:MAG: hypothetical protein JXQ83_09880 [Candidatus Glassbacteria bacterium]|nr:hypothetical protein [Candidatus Glassbacteria bacterium]
MAGNFRTRRSAALSAPALLLLSLLAAGPAIQADTGFAAARYREDVNGDGKVNIVDAIALILLGRQDPGDPAADYNGDGVYTIADAVALVLSIMSGSLTPVQDEPLPGEAEHRELPPGAVAVSGPGSYAGPGTTYMLTRDVSSPASAIFLGNDVTLDLNGYTVSFADGGYEQVPNYGFEQGLEGWDLSGAPNARVEDAGTVQTFTGEKILRLPYGEEIASAYITLPVADRSYYAVCGVASSDMRVTINVDDESGKPVYCSFVFGGNVRVTCPETDRAPKLGGGIVFAHLHGLPAGKYRVRVKAQTNCLIDEVDIRPALDVGIGIVDQTYPWAYYKCILDGDYTAFFDYTEQGTTSMPAGSVPRVEGPGTITVRNGVVRSGPVGIRSWGLQSTAGQAVVVLENVRFVSSGINANAVDVPAAVIRNCRFEMDAPFIIDRHRISDQPVALRGETASEVSDCQFIGGQGCLTVAGRGSQVNGSLFVNRQMATNHYSINVSGDGTHIFDNRFEPETGSGIFISARNVEVYRNNFVVSSSPPTCEYGHEDYSVNAVRISDYNARPGSAEAAYGNRVYGNVFRITGRDYPLRPSYVPMVYAVFLSVGGGANYIYDNEVVVEHLDPGSKAEAAAFYLGSSDNGGEWYGNTLTSNVPAVWVASRYGSAARAKFCSNTFIKAENAPESYKPVRMGWGSATAKDIEFRSNVFEGSDFAVEATGQDHSYSVFWTLTVEVLDRAGNPLADEQVVVTDNAGSEVATGKTDGAGEFAAELIEYQAAGSERACRTPYTVAAAGMVQEANLDRNTRITVKQQ